MKFYKVLGMTMPSLNKTTLEKCPQERTGKAG